MQTSNRMRALSRAAAFCLFAMHALALSAAEHEAHAKSTKPVKAELGTSAAADAQGRIWVVGKEAAEDGQYVVLQMSADLGTTWSAPKRIQREPEAVSADGENRPKIAFGRKGEIYVAYTKPLAKPYTGEIRFVRSTDGGRSFTPPVTVHANRDLITHRFESLIVDREGRVYVAWIDKRDLHAAEARKQKYAGAAVYYAVSSDAGASFKGDYKLADHSCECCRIALALNPQGRPVALWRHVFEPNVRDHALMELTPDGKPGILQRASFDDWRIDACPHHGPALAYGNDGRRHQAWFNVKEGAGGVFYAAADAASANAQEGLGSPVRLGSAQAAHADIATAGRAVALAWKQFDGKGTAILARLSNDGGQTWQETELARTQGASDQPRLLTTPAGIVLVWRTQDEGIRTVLAHGRQQ